MGFTLEVGESVRVCDDGGGGQVQFFQSTSTWEGVVVLGGRHGVHR